MATERTTDELLRARRKLVALRRAEFSLQQRFDKIDWELDKLRGEISALESAAAKGELPEFAVGAES